MSEAAMNPMQFIYTSAPQRVRFGAGSVRHLNEELDQLGAKRALVLSTPQQRGVAEGIAATMGDRAVGIYDQAVMHVPMESARAAQQIAKEMGADCAVAVGGGSTIGLGKAIALDSGLPILAIPTTYAGSEMTPIFGLTENGVKRTGKDLRVLPKTVIYDPELTVGLPVAMSVTSAINAIAHAAEGLYASDGNPIMSLMAEEGIRAIGQNLGAIVQQPNDLAARAQVLYGAWLCGAVLGNVGMALHHKLCHTLGGTFNLPHAETHTIVLPHALAYNDQAAPEAMQRIARAHAGGGHHQIFADAPRRAGQQPAAADIGDQADAGFGHGDLGGIADDPVAGMAADADAAAHDEALHEGQDGLGVIGDGRIHAVFVEEEARALGVIAGAASMIDGGNIAAGAKSLVAGSVDDDQIDQGVIAPVLQRRMDRPRHVMAERVQRLRAVEGDPTGAAVAADDQIIHQPRSASMLRLTIRRMISFVPSRIWWTRRSRTSFSMP